MTASDDDLIQKGQDDLIRRGDAIDRITKLSCDDDAHWGSIVDALRTIPSTQVSVKPLEWVELEKYRRGGKYSADGYTIRYVEGFFILDFAGEGKWKWRWTDIAAAIRSQPHDRTALDRMLAEHEVRLREAREKALREAYQAVGRIVAGYELREDFRAEEVAGKCHDAILALIEEDKEN